MSAAGWSDLRIEFASSAMWTGARRVLSRGLVSARIRSIEGGLGGLPPCEESRPSWGEGACRSFFEFGGVSGRGGLPVNVLERMSVERRGLDLKPARADLGTRKTVLCMKNAWCERSEKKAAMAVLNGKSTNLQGTSSVQEKSSTQFDHHSSSHPRSTAKANISLKNKFCSGRIGYRNDLDSIRRASLEETKGRNSPPLR